MRTLYFDCFAGASGNMILGALVSLGVDREDLLQGIGKLNVPDFGIEFTEVERSGIGAVHARTVYPEEKKHRHLSDIERIINDSDLSRTVKERAVSIFRRLAEAEARVHGVSVEKVHFHEVGAMDAIIDVVGACVGFELLGVERFVCSEINVGGGYIEIEHGLYPVPPPAVAELLQGIPFRTGPVDGELMTPTGAAVIAAVCGEYGGIEGFGIERIGYGAGTRTIDGFPNVLRLMLGETQAAGSTGGGVVRDELLLIETNLDDVTSEVLGFVLEEAFGLGALDCWFTPIQMKKNRPGTLVSILCRPSERERFTGLLYAQTPTLGLRLRTVSRECLPRETGKIKTEFGEVGLKIAKFKEQVVNVKPEYDDIRRIARETGLALREVERRIMDEYKRLSEDKSFVGKKS